MFTLLPVTLELVHNQYMELLAAINLITYKPAQLMGLKAGRLAPEEAADLVIFDPNIGWKVTEERLHSKSKNSPFDGRPVQGQVLRTVVDGRTVFVRES